MLDLAGGTTVYLACGATDLRKSYHGLAAIIKLKFKLDPYSRCMFAFCNRRRTSIKIRKYLIVTEGAAGRRGSPPYLFLIDKDLRCSL